MLGMTKSTVWVRIHADVTFDDKNILKKGVIDLG
jgi:uncharacterized pyridoxamine 5'-phosphate oxidase family protein